MLKNFEKEDWIIYYINWEIFLLKELGFDPFLKQFSSESNQITKFKTIEIDNTKYLVPIFLLSRKINQKLENKEISMALSFVRNILSNKFFFPNNLVFPKSRTILENYFN